METRWTGLGLRMEGPNQATTARASKCTGTAGVMQREAPDADWWTVSPGGVLLLRLLLRPSARWRQHDSDLGYLDCECAYQCVRTVWLDMRAVRAVRRVALRYAVAVPRPAPPAVPPT